MPVTHEPRLEIDVVANVAQIVGKTLVQREILAVDRHGDVAGITAAPDDACLREQQCDQSQFVEIERRLVDQAQCIRRGAPGCRPEVAVSRIAQCGVVDLIDAGRPAGAGTGAQGKVAYDKAYVRQLAAAETGGMCGEDLLGQRGAAAWHADDEQRAWVRVAAPSPASLLEAFARHGPDHHLDLVAGAFQVGGPDQPPSGAVGFIPSVHGVRVTLASVEHLAQFVTQQGAVRVGQCRIAQHHDGSIDGGVIGFRAIQAQQPAEGERPVGPCLQGRQIGVSRSIPVAPVLGGLRKRNQQISGLLGCACHRGEEIECLLVLAEPVECFGETECDQGVAWPEFT
ncbi:hypothetical protein MUU75_15825 [Pseudoxanthomonas mexicana]|nr:hypothetical protein [Pseudoxanthomonas mexicana]UOV04561.1 hypothetical protein MUU75_15825 [Pseudoxanthomonas mexicana]